MAWRCACGLVNDARWGSCMGLGCVHTKGSPGSRELTQAEINRVRFTPRKKGRYGNPAEEPVGVSEDFTFSSEEKSGVLRLGEETLTKAQEITDSMGFRDDVLAGFGGKEKIDKMCDEILAGKGLFTKNIELARVKGGKADQGKLPFDLLPVEALEAYAAVMRMGAVKYAERNWEQKPMAWGRLFAAAMRHLWSWWAKRGVDDESGLSHLAHAFWCIGALITYEARNIGQDDRP